MEYKNMREVYKGNIWEIRQPEFLGSNRLDNYMFKFDKNIVISLEKNICL